MSIEIDSIETDSIETGGIEIDSTDIYSYSVFDLKYINSKTEGLNMPLIIRCKKLDRFMVEDINAQSIEGMSFKSLKEMLGLLGFESKMIQSILGESRINPAIYVDEVTHTYKLFTNSDKKFNPNSFFTKMFDSMASSNNIERFDQGNKSFGMKNFQMNSNRSLLISSNANLTIQNKFQI